METNFLQTSTASHYEEVNPDVVEAARHYEYAAQRDMFLSKAIRWIVYAAAFLLPLWFLSFTADIVEFNKQILLVVLAGVGLVLYLIQIIKTGVMRMVATRFYIPIALFVVAAIVSTIFSVNRHVSTFGIGTSRGGALITVAALAVMFFLALNVIEDRGRMLKKIAAVSFFAAFVYAILQFFGVFILGGIFKNSVFNSIGSFNSLGMLAAVSLGFLIPSLRSGSSADSTGRSIVRKVFFAAWLVMAMFLIVLLNWLFIWIVALVSVVISATLSSAVDFSIFKKNKIQFLVLPAVIIVSGIFLMLTDFSLDMKSKLPAEVAPTQRASVEIAVKTIREKPFGIGQENFIVAYERFRPESVAGSTFFNVKLVDAASEALTVAVEGGVLAALAILLFAWFYIRKFAAAVRVRMGGDLDSVAFWSASIALSVAYFLYPFNLSMLAAAAILFLLVMLSDKTDQPEARVFDLENNAKYSFVGSLMFIAGLAAVVVTGYFAANNYLANIYLARATIASEHSKAIDWYVKSANLNSSDARTYRLLSQSLLAKLTDDLNKGPEKSENRESYDAKIQNNMVSVVNIAKRATTVEPSNSENWINAATIYQNLIGLIGGADQAAVSALNEALSRDPNNPGIYIRIGNVYFSVAERIDQIIANSPRRSGGELAALAAQVQGNFTKAEENYQKAISFNGRLAEAMYNLAVVYDRQGKLSESIKQFEKLQASNSQDAGIVFQLGLLYYQNGQKDNAFRAWQRAVALFPGYSNARWYLSLAYEERGDLESALEQVKEIDRLNPNNDLVRQRLDKLEAGLRTVEPGGVLDNRPI